MITAHVGILAGDDREKATQHQRTGRDVGLDLDEVMLSSGWLLTVGSNSGPPSRAVFTHSPM